MPDKYLAITIGPIYKTIKQAKKTRELWAASYMFSLLMRKLLNQFKDTSRYVIIAPSDIKIEPAHGAGLWPDRCFIHLRNPIIEDLDSIIDNALKELCAVVMVDCSNLKKYLQIYVVNHEVKGNILMELNELLDALELQASYSSKPSIDWSNAVWNTKTNNNFFTNLYDIAYTRNTEEELKTNPNLSKFKDILPPLIIQYSDGSCRESVRFPSIPEIATKELEIQNPEMYWKKVLGYEILNLKEDTLYFPKLRKQESDIETENDDLFISAMKSSYKGLFKTRHKYVCVIHADGDNIGEIIKSLTDNTGIEKFSQTLMDVAQEASHILANYGALPIYIGGDDLLFFAPIAGNYNIEQESNNIGNLPNYSSGKPLKTDGKWQTPRNIFELLNALDDSFKAAFKGTNISLSFGLSIGYYKHPMNELLEKSQKLLFYKAKKFKARNSIAFEVEKHSGQQFGALLNMNANSYSKFIDMIRLSSRRNQNSEFLNSVMYKLHDQELILESALNDNSNMTIKANRIKSFFEQNFNEVYNSKQSFFDNISEFLICLNDENNNAHPNDKKAFSSVLNTLYGSLRFIHFLNSEDDNE